MPVMVRINVGCGATPTAGWENLDNSVTVRLARLPGAVEILSRLGVLNSEQSRFAKVAMTDGVRWADVTRKIPYGDSSVDVVYSSHMLEHLDREEARRFLEEVLRVLRP